MTDRDRLERVARDWIAGDPDERTRAQLEDLLRTADDDTLRDHVDGALEFGTAGIRGVVGPGPMRMNRAVVIRTTCGLAAHLRGRGLEGRPVVVGFDARPDSHRFAADTIGVLLAAGFEVHFVPEPAPTPLVAFATRYLDAAAGVVITASHNPPEYNGYKVYADNGAQIVPPTDAEIAALIDAVGPASEVPRVDDPWGAAGARPLGEDLEAAYFEALDASRPPSRAHDVTLPIAYTPLHGVGWGTLDRAMRRSGYAEVHPVAEQRDPDGAFPTVRFPNPEEPGALDLAEATADEVGAGLVLANDPDADRLAVAVRDDGGWRPLSGNQIGVLLGEYLLERTDVGDPLVVSSIVSSPMLGEVAAAVGARYEVTLTGFKWICNAALDLERETGATFVFGYEEALGYTVGRAVRDKDGIGAALAFADLAAETQAAGATLLDRLGDLYRRYGLWVSVQHAITRPGLEGLEEIATAMERIGTSRHPDTLVGRRVTRVEDLRHGEEARPRWLPATPLVALEIDGGRVLVRPSGTEPKLKIYADLRTDLADGEDWAVREGALRDDAAAVAAELAGFLGLA